MHTYLYRAPAGLPALNEWTSVQLGELAEPLGSIAAVRQQLDELFANLQWQQFAGAWCGGHAQCQEPYIDIMLTADAAGHCRFIVFDKAASSVIESVMRSFALNYACTPENGRLLVSG
jgi:hypothetical protein